MSRAKADLALKLDERVDALWAVEEHAGHMPESHAPSQCMWHLYLRLAAGGACVRAPPVPPANASLDTAHRVRTARGSC